MPLQTEGTHRTFWQNVTLAVLLAWVAGAVNAAGFFLLGLHTSHMTGHAAAIGEAVARAEHDLAWNAVQVVVAFVVGATSASALLELTARWRRGRYTPALALEACVLGGSAALAMGQQGARAPALVWALSFAMGLQNALVTRISGAVVRTTHLTGVLTDLGIEAGRMLRLVFSRSTGEAGRMERVGLHLSLLGAFITGAISGTEMLGRSGAFAIALPSVVLLGLMVLDWRPPRSG